jgi:bifunctional non-homologous end joining protein LigD
MKAIVLYYNDLATGGSSDKEYRTQITRQGSGYIVQFQYGRRGNTLQAGVKTNEPVPLDEAERIYERLVHEKTSKGYQPAKGNAPAPLAPTPIEKTNMPGRTQYPVELLEEISREDAELFLKDSRYIMQVKLDGHRRQVEKLPDGRIISYNKKGEPKPLPLEVEHELAELPLKTFLFDGELIGNWYIVFEMLKENGVCLALLPYEERLNTAIKAIPKGTNVTIVATWWTAKEKQAALAQLFKNRSEGAVFKLRSAPYHAGRGSGRKYKFIKTVSCRVSAIKTKGHDNVTLSLLDGSKWVEVGRASAIGKGAIRVGEIVEVKFLYCTEGRRLYQPRVLCKRDDLEYSECSVSQLKGKYKEGVAA